ncbi:MAG: UDP-N-acetylmuramoyl-tripeptide--D-alanyl-D-alanine ligase, partial [Anaerovoracaceae bacterium]
MKTLSMGEVVAAINGELICGDQGDEICQVSIDSRTVTGETLFFALKGEKHDGHDFIKGAIAQGGRSFVIADPDCLSEEARQGINLIKVADPAKALGDLARYYLSLLEIKIIGVTGSTGKTSTKDMLYAICKEKFVAGCTAGNYNNHLGLPLTVLGFEEGTQVGILEMGMDKVGEIDYLVNIAHPDIGVITNIGISHMENLGSREGIFKAKMEITNCFSQENTLVINTGKDYLQREKVQGAYRVMTTGEEQDNDLILSQIEDRGAEGISFLLEHKGETQKFSLPVPGKHNGLNASVAVAAGLCLGISMEEAAAGLAKMTLTEGRMTIKEKDGVKVIDDTYNASPDSMKAAIDVLMATKGRRKLAILGDMFELGKDTEGFHQEVGEYAASAGVDKVIAVGELAKSIAKGAGAC